MKYILILTVLLGISFYAYDTNRKSKMFTPISMARRQMMIDEFKATITDEPGELKFMRWDGEKYQEEKI